jgi:transcriptional regulator with XRE-family HTH domain
LTDNKLLAIELISSPKRITREQVAELCGISRMQLWRWEQRKDFRKAVDRAIKEKIQREMSGKTTYVYAALAGDVNALQVVLSIAFGIGGVIKYSRVS